MPNYLFFVFAFPIVLLTSCTASENLDKFKLEIDFLKKENKELKNQLKAFDNSIVIQSSEIHEFLMPVTFGPIAVDKNEKSMFETHLVLRKLPENIDWKWTSSPEAMNLKNAGIPHYVTTMYENKGERKFNGTYQLTFPSGQSEQFNWQREFEVK